MGTADLRRFDPRKGYLTLSSQVPELSWILNGGSTDVVDLVDHPMVLDSETLRRTLAPRGPNQSVPSTEMALEWHVWIPRRHPIREYV